MASEGQDVAIDLSKVDYDSDLDLDLCDVELPSEKRLREVGTLLTSEQLGKLGQNKEETAEEHVAAPANPNLLENAENSSIQKDTEQQDSELPEYDSLEELQSIERTDRGQKGASGSEGAASSGPNLVVADGGKGPGKSTAKIKSTDTKKGWKSAYAKGLGKQPMRKCVSFPAFSKLDKTIQDEEHLPEYDTLEELDTSAGPGPDRGKKGVSGEDMSARVNTDDVVMVDERPRPGSSKGKIKSKIAKAGRTSPYPKGHTPPGKIDKGKKPPKKSKSSPAISALDQKALPTEKERAQLYQDFMEETGHTVENPQQNPEILPDATDSLTNAGNAVTVAFNVMCAACMTPHGHNSMVECCHEHVICTQCVEKAAKTALKGESKGSVICCKDGCSSSIPQSELRKALPSLVMDLLEERWRRETLDALEDMQDIVICTVCGFSGALDFTIKQFECSKCKKTYCRYCQMQWHLKQHDLCFKTKARKLPDMGAVVEIPAHWHDESDRAMQCTVILSKHSHEYKEISWLFYTESMGEKFNIVEIHRIQNLRLWDRYYLTRSHFVADLGELHIRELRLFHGTKRSSVKAICEQGFDWRVCGKNGTKYGDGTYFAKYSTYSHLYSKDVDTGPSSSTTTSTAGSATTSTAASTTTSGVAFQISTTNPFRGVLQSSTVNSFQGSPQSSTANLQSSPANPFGGAQQSSTANPFGGAPPTSTTNPFGSAPQTSTTNPFGGALPTSTTNPFGVALPTSITNPFGGALPTPTTNPFGGALPTPTTNPFGGALPTPTTNPFGGALPTTSTNPFGGALPTPTTNPFGGALPTPTTNPFGGALPTPTPNPFGGALPTPTPNPFGGALPTPTTNPFGGALPTSTYTSSGGFPSGGALTTLTSSSTGGSSQQNLAASYQYYWSGTPQQRTSCSGFTFGLTQQSSSTSGSGSRHSDISSVNTPGNSLQNSNPGSSTVTHGAQTLSSTTGLALPQPTLPSNTSGPSSCVQSCGQSGVFPTSTSTAGRSAFVPVSESGSHLFVKPLAPRSPPSNSSYGTCEQKGIEDTEDYLMFVGRVLVGRTCHGHHGMRRPEKDPDNGSTCHTAVDYINKPNIFVIFDMTQCYPEYLIRYRDRVD